MARKHVVRVGTAGIPLSCKGTSTLEGIDCVHGMGLDAMEIEFVRSIYLSREASKKVGQKARDLSVELSVHAPYAINLASKNERVRKNSVRMIAECLDRASLAGARIVVVHAGYYSGQAKSHDIELVEKGFEAARELSRVPKKRVLIGMETMGRQSTIGTLEETILVSERVEGVVPVIDFGHIHARTHGGLRTVQDFARVIDTVESHGLGDWHHCHISCVYHEDGNEKHHLPLSAREPDFSLLARAIVENGYKLTCISESPLIEKDALVFRDMIEQEEKKHARREKSGEQ